MSGAPAATAARALALRRGVRLEAGTVLWMTLEAALAIGAGVAARSVLLTAFGVDSVIELLSGATLLWRLRAEAGGEGEEAVDELESRAVRLSAVLLSLLCLYVVVTSGLGLLARVAPLDSWLGVGVSGAALLVMPWLASRKRRANQVIQSPALRADIAESASCAFMAGVTLAGLAVSALTGWWWVQYPAALSLLAWLLPEAREAFEAAWSGGGRG